MAPGANPAKRHDSCTSPVLHHYGELRAGVLQKHDQQTKPAPPSAKLGCDPKHLWCMHFAGMMTSSITSMTTTSPPSRLPTAASTKLTQVRVGS